MSGEEALTAAGGWCAPSDPGSRDLGVDLIYPGVWPMGLLPEDIDWCLRMLAECPWPWSDSTDSRTAGLIWVRSDDALWHRCCIGIPDEPESHINVSWSGWRVQQVASWWEISSGRTVVVTRRWATLEQVVAIVRVLGALPMPGSSVADP